MAQQGEPREFRAEPDVLADLRQLSPEPATLPGLLARYGYRTAAYESGFYAPGQSDLPALLFQLYRRASLVVRDTNVSGRHIARSAVLAALMVSLRRSPHRPPLIFLQRPSEPPPGVARERIVSLEGGVVPRIWRNCYGTFDVLIRVVGKRSHPGLPNIALNAIEASVPVLDALARLAAELSRRKIRRGSFDDAPLLPRLTLAAAHGGLRGSLLPTIFDIVVSRRYGPEEAQPLAFAEIASTVRHAAPPGVELDFALGEHRPPLPDPDAGRRSLEERALAAGWGWPQVPFCPYPTLIEGVRVLGGLERPDSTPADEETTVAFEEIAALSRTICALLTAHS